MTNSMGAASKQLRMRTRQERLSLLRNACPYLLGTVLVTPLVAVLATQRQHVVSRPLVAALQLCLAAVMFLPIQERDAARLHTPVRDAAFGGLIGGVSTLIGVGGGTYTIAYFVYGAGTRFRDAIATANLTGLVIGALSVAGYLLPLWWYAHGPATPAGPISAPGMATLIAAGVLAAPLGVRLSHSLPVKRPRQILVLISIPDCRIPTAQRALPTHALAGGRTTTRAAPAHQAAVLTLRTHAMFPRNIMTLCATSIALASVGGCAESSGCPALVADQVYELKLRDFSHACLEDATLRWPSSIRAAEGSWITAVGWSMTLTSLKQTGCGVQLRVEYLTGTDARALVMAADGLVSDANSVHGPVNLEVSTRAKEDRFDFSTVGATGTAVCAGTAQLTLVPSDSNEPIGAAAKRTAAGSGAP